MSKIGLARRTAFSHVTTRFGLALLASVAGLPASALPQNPNVTFSSPGQTGFFYSGPTLTVTSSARRSVIDWAQFNIGLGETVTFNLPDGRSIVVNRVQAGANQGFSSSLIDGVLNSNGNVWLLNPNGVVFGSNARVDVNGLLATTGMLLDPQVFVDSTLEAPIAFGPGALTADGVRVFQGAQIVTRGGPAMFVATGGPGGRVYIGGSVTGGGSTEETATSQVLYASAGAFTLRLSETAPNSLTSSDLQLFDFIVDAPASQGAGFGNGQDRYASILVDQGSVTRAGSVSIISDVLPSQDTDLSAEITIRSKIEATSPDRVETACPVASCPALLVEARRGETVRFDRTAFALGGQGAVLGDLVELMSAGSIRVSGGAIEAIRKRSVFGDDGEVSVPDHETVRFNSLNTRLNGGKIRLENSRLNGAVLNGLDIYLSNSFVDPMAGDIFGRSLLIDNGYNQEETPPSTGVPDITIGHVSVEGGEVNVRTAGRFNARTIRSDEAIRIEALKGARLDALRGADIRINTLDGRLDVGGSASAGPLPAGSIVATTGDVTLDAAQAAVVGNVSAAGEVKARSQNASLTTGTVNAGSTVTFVGRTGVTAGAIAGTGTIIVDSSTGAVVTGDVSSSGGDINVLSGAQALLGDLTAGGRIDLSAMSGSVTAGIVNAGGDLLVRADTLVSAASARARQIDIESANGGIRVGVGGSGSFTPGALVSTGGDIRLQGKGQIDAGDVTSAARIIAGSATDIVRLGLVNSTLSASIAGAAGVRVGDVVSGTFLDLSSVNGTVTAGDLLAQNGYARALGQTGVDVGSVQATAEAQLTSAAGSALADRVQAGGDVVIEGRNGVEASSVAGRSVRLASSGGAIGVGVLSGGTFTRGGVQASAGVLRMTSSGDIKSGDLSGSDGVDVQSSTGTIDVGAVQSGRTILLNGKSGVISGALDAATGLDVFSDGGISVGSAKARAGTLRIKAGGSMTVGDASASQDLELESRSGSVSAADVTAGGTVLGRSSQGFRASSLRGNAVDVASSNSDVLIGASTQQGFVGGSVQALDGGVRLSSATGLKSGAISASGGITALAGTGEGVLGALTGGGRVEATATGDLSTGAVDAGLGVGLRSTQGSLTSGPVSARGGDAVLAGDRGVVAGSISATGAVDLDSARGSVAAGDIAAIASISARSAGGFSARSVRGSSVSIINQTGPLQVGVQGNAFTGGAVISTSGRTDLSSGGDVRVGEVTSAQALSVSSSNGGVQAGVVSGSGRVDVLARSDISLGAVSGVQGVRVASSAGSVTAQAITSRDAEAVVSAATAVSVADVTATGDIELRSAAAGVSAGLLVGRDLKVDAGGGNVSIGGADGRTLRLSATAGAAGAGSVLANGQIRLNSRGGSAADTGIGLGLIASGSVTLSGAVTSQRDVVIDAGGLVQLNGPVTVQDALGGVGEANSPIGRLYGGVDIRAADLQINGDVTVSGAAGVNLASKGQAGIVIGDGVSGDTGLRVSNAELQRIRAPSLSLRGSLTQAGGGNVTLGTFSLDAAKVRSLMATTGSQGRVRVPGVVSGSGGASIAFGEADLATGGVEITGALGTESAPIGPLSFLSSGSVLIGSQAFVDLVNAAADPARVDLSAILSQLGSADAGKTYITAGATTFNVSGVILQQNTGGATGGGIRLATPSTGGMFAAGADRIALFGTIIGRDGVSVSGPGVAKLPGLLSQGVAPTDLYRINGCVIGSPAACGGGGDIQSLVTAGSSPPPAGEPGPDGDRERDREGDGPRPEEAAAEALSGSETTAGPISIDDTARDLFIPETSRAEKDPGVGTANEDLWPQGL